MEKSEQTNDFFANTNIQFDGSESLAVGELANLRKYCFNFVVLKFGIKNRSKKDTQVQSVLQRSPLVTPHTLMALQGLWNEEDPAVAVKMAKQFKSKVRQTIKMLLTYFMPIFRFKYHLLHGLLSIAKDYMLSVVFEMILEHLFKTLLLGCEESSILVQYLNTMLDMCRSVAVSSPHLGMVTEDNLMHFKRRPWKAAEAKDSTAVEVRKVEFESEHSQGQSGQGEPTALLSFLLPFKSDMAFERVIKLTGFFRKNMLYLLLWTESERLVESFVVKLLTFPLKTTKAMSLKVFTSISKTFFCFFHQKINSLQLRQKHEGVDDHSPTQLMELFLQFCVDFFSAGDHFFVKKETEYSVSDFDTYHKVVQDLYSLFLTLSAFANTPFKQTTPLVSKVRQTFFNKFSASLSGVSGHLTRLSDDCWHSQRYKSVQKGRMSVALMIKVVLSFIKERVDSLRAKTLFDYVQVDTGPAYQAFKMTDPEVLQSVENLLFLNPQTAVLFCSMLID